MSEETREYQYLTCSTARVYMHVITVNIYTAMGSGIRIDERSSPFCKEQQVYNALLLHISLSQSPYNCNYSLKVTARRFVSLKGASCQLTAMIPFTHAWHVYVRGPVHLATHAQ